MKCSIFTWGWAHFPRTIDPKQTRDNMARLMRSWRRARTNNGQIINRVTILERSKKGRVYQVINTPTGERATFAVTSQCQ